MTGRFAEHAPVDVFAAGCQGFHNLERAVAGLAFVGSMNLGMNGVAIDGDILWVGGERHLTVSEGNGPVNALDNALRKALEKFYPQLRSVRLVDYKVRVLPSGEGTGSHVRVLIQSGDGQREWSTVGVSYNIIEASWQALADSLEYALLKQNGQTA